MAKLYAKAPDGSDALLPIVITGFTQSLQQNGWCKLPNGLLFQWFGNSVNINKTTTFSYIIEFRFNPYQLVGSYSSGVGIRSGLFEFTGYSNYYMVKFMTSDIDAIISTFNAICIGN